MTKKNDCVNIAVYWHSLDTDGSRDDLSLHGACPTALGLKWVSNKWIRNKNISDISSINELMKYMHQFRQKKYDYK